MINNIYLLELDNIALEQLMQLSSFYRTKNKITYTISSASQNTVQIVAIQAPTAQNTTALDIFTTTQTLFNSLVKDRTIRVVAIPYNAKPEILCNDRGAG